MTGILTSKSAGVVRLDNCRNWGRPCDQSDSGLTKLYPSQKPTEFATRSPAHHSIRRNGPLLHVFGKHGALNTALPLYPLYRGM